jgi:hypothetical protein
MADDFERAILYAFDHTGAVGPELKVRKREEEKKKKKKKKKREKEEEENKNGIGIFASRSFPHLLLDCSTSTTPTETGPRRRLLRLRQGLPRRVESLRR